ncbi:MAG: pyrroline-5-carboxylate reductase [Planctomycetes bacterium]|nr:pyrroline-5-carboxylate reductase [Planctomycetota bacterium]
MISRILKIYGTLILPKITETLGFIGAGRMATALARGCVQSGLVEAGRVLAVDPSQAAMQAFAEEIPNSRAASNHGELLDGAQIIVLAVKPQIMPGVLEAISEHLGSGHLVVSIAAGVTLSTLAAALPTGTRLVRVMPNTPCLVGLGASCYSCGAAASEGDSRQVQKILESVGGAYEVEEDKLDAVTGLSGSGPAFVYRMIETMAEGGVAGGLTQELALKLAAQTARGAAEMVLSTGSSPAELRQQVTSPGGTTQAGLETLENLSGPDAFRAAVEAATQRSKELGR